VIRDQRGAALIVVLMALTLLLGLGGGLAMLTTTEADLAVHFGHGLEALYAAEAGLERAMLDLRLAPDWSAALDGSARSTFAVGAPSGPRPLPAGGTLDLTAATNLELCGRTSVCSEAEMDATTAERPDGVNNPRWRPYAFGPIRDLLPAGRIRSRLYVVVWVGDDPWEIDGAPLVDGQPAVSPGHGVVRLRARAYGARGARRGIEVVVARISAGVRVVSWREL
jgi:hypothetical protein